MVTVDRDAAKAELEQALGTYVRLGATAYAERVRRTQDRLRLAPSRRRGRPSAGNGLSPRERDVVDLVARGMTNREVAETLFLSRRTVEFHVANAMKKTGVSSRTALALHVVATDISP